MARVLPCLGAFAIALVSAGALAEPPPDPARELELIESTERSEDPLGIDEQTGRELERAAARVKPPVAQKIVPSASRGATLSSIAGVKESAHVLDIELTQGLAFVTARLTFTSAARHAAEIAYRFSLPPAAVVTGVSACAAKRCATAEPGGAEAESSYHAALMRSGATEPPIISASPIVDRAGNAVALRVAPVAPQSELAVEVRYVVEAPVRGGRARFRVEPRGYDPNLAPTSIRVRTRELSRLEPASELTFDAWSSVELSATLAQDKGIVRSETRAVCGTARCSRRYEVAPSGDPVTRPTWLLLDASPSMEGPARGRASSVLAALLSVLPESTSVRAFAFAARSAELGTFRAADAPLAALSDALLRDLDGATHLAPVLSRPELPRERPRVIVVSDGSLDPIASEVDALRRARAAGAELVLVSVGDREPSLRASFDRTLMLANIAERTLHGEPLEPLMDALRQLVEREARPGLPAGEQRVVERAPKRTFACAVDGSWLCFWLGRHATPARWLASDGHGAGAVVALPYESAERVQEGAATGLPAESVLSMLRTQLVPQARGCLRTDRKGRADYAVGLTFHALFAQREAYEVRIAGDIPKPLRACLDALVPKLNVPLFTGRIRVKYPIHTEREPTAPIIELEPELGRTLERAFAGPHALP